MFYFLLITSSFLFIINLLPTIALIFAFAAKSNMDSISNDPAVLLPQTETRLEHNKKEFKETFPFIIIIKLF